MIKDLNKNITSIRYNHLNLPTEIKFNNSNNKKITYIYSSDGIKQRKVVNNNGHITTTDYAGSYIYQKGKLEFINTSEGYVMPNNKKGFDYVYHYKDHLGNIRLSYRDANNNGKVTQSEIIEEKNYYPFGLQHKGYNDAVNSLGNSLAQKFGYNGKELQDEHNLDWYDFSARNYDASLGRWMNVDPLVEETIQPYSAMNNNPINFVDPTGMKADDYYFDREGNYLGSDNAKTDVIRIIDKTTWNDKKIIDENGVESIDHDEGVRNSKVHSESDISDESSLKIYKYYNPTGLELEKNNRKTMQFSRTLIKKGNKIEVKDVKIKINIEKNKVLKTSDHANEIINLFSHENKHYEDFKTLGNKKYSNLTLKMKERSAYYSQM